jgi:hypothetical protein
MAAVMYHAATGAAPPAAPTRLARDRHVPAVRAARRGFARARLEAIDWALACDDRDRPPNIAAWRAALDGAIPAATPGRRGARAGEPPARWPWIAAAALAAAAAVGLAALLL